jgi:hypothetical protein
MLYKTTRGELSMAAAQVFDPPVHHKILKDDETVCCIVGGGPAGAMLALVLARRSVRVTLLEMHQDFDREFRGDTVHPSTLEILDQLGLAERVHELPSNKISAPTLLSTRGPFTPFDLSRLKTKYRYILMVHQKDLLALLTQEAKKYSSFRLLMGAKVTDLIREDGGVRGVRYQMEDGIHELRAVLTVGADGGSRGCVIWRESSRWALHHQWMCCGSAYRILQKRSTCRVARSADLPSDIFSAASIARIIGKSRS